ncbi:hypothetical protein FOCC_FOCC006217 [Frankliniella occidentalis]|nr:hypothetical protein FOCC_FOCC006217 [Frankliniella occidentalis]
MEPRSHLLCSYCNPYKYLSNTEEFKQHLKRYHWELKTFRCGHCRTIFQHKTSLIRHISDVANQLPNSEVEDVSSSENDEEGAEGYVSCIEDHIMEDERIEEREEVREELNQNNVTFDIKAEAAKFLMKLRSSGNLTQASVKFIEDNVVVLLQNLMLNAEAKTREFLNSCDLPPENVDAFLAGDAFKIGNPFEDLESVEEQLAYFCEKFGCVIPEEKYLGFRIENRFDRKLRMFLPKQVSETFQYVSAIGSLTMIVRNAYLRNLILNEKQSADGVYRSHRDGSDFKNNEFLRKYPFAIRIVIYYDDLEITNALGSKDVIHKLGCFYFGILNLPPEESSQLASIFLLALCAAEDLHKPHAYEKILTIFLEELRRLQSDEGVEVTLENGETFILRACLVCLTADSLAAHHMMGFLSPSADKFCRICLISKTEISLDTTAVGILRTSDLHKQHLLEVEESPENETLYGVRYRTPLIDVMRIPEDSVFDVFHDAVGVIQMTIKLALYEFICVRKLFSDRLFNSRIEQFVYGKSDKKNKPSANFEYRKLKGVGHKLRQYGAQTFLLLRVFPFLITKVAETDPYLELVFLLQDAMRIIFSPELRESDIDRLQNTLTNLQRLFHRIFISPEPENVAPVQNDGEEEEQEEDGQDDQDDQEEEDDEVDDNINENLENETAPRRRCKLKSKRLKKGINKLHHLTHYPMQMREKGPLIRLWCAKFEGRHRLIRKHAAVQHNFKNPPKTMARMFQMSTLAAFLDLGGPRPVNISASELGYSLVELSQYRNELVAQGFLDTDVVRVVESVEVYGVEYQAGLFVILNGNGVGAHPLFAIIEDIVVDSSAVPKIVLIVKMRSDVVP